MKLGIVFEGGASRVYFSCGIMEGLERERIMADVVVGASAGIANGVSYVTRQSRRNYVIATRFANDPRYMGLRHWLNPDNRCYYNLSFVFEEIPCRRLPFNFRAFQKWPGQVFAAVTNVQTGKAEYLPVPRDGRSFKVLQASCALPILFPPITINGTAYMDGGIVNSIPVQPALDAGCDKIIVVLTQPRGYQKEDSRSMHVIAKKYAAHPAFAEALRNRARTYNQDLARIEELEKEGRVFVMAPPYPLGIKRTENDPQVLSNLYHLGLSTFDAQLGALRHYLEA